ncbi:hypothetical protein FQN54_008132 [Arachnomyces sp. PD_36]|nr:hypothetical protein FQN54_008132 [Arachnomyces sp. PD_36]
MQQAGSKRFFHIVGRVSVEDVVRRSGTGWQGGFDTALPSVRQKYPTAKTAIIQGSQAHKSSKDPLDPKNVVTLAMYDENDVRVGSAHIHEDGTFTDHPSRAGESKVVNQPQGSQGGKSGS